MREMARTKKIEIEEIDKEYFFELVTEEIIDNLFEQNLLLMELLEQEEYELCSQVQENIKNFLLDTSKVLQKYIGGRTQKYYMHFTRQNHIVYNELLKEILGIK